MKYPRSVAVDISGNIYIADTDNRRIRKVTINTGIITTVADLGSYGFSGDGGLATAAESSDPLGVAVDISGKIYIADAIWRCRCPKRLPSGRCPKGLPKR